MSLRLVLASASPARLTTLLAAGLDPLVVVSGVEEDVVAGETATRLCARLATAKANAVDADELGRNVVVLGCDSVLELDGQVYGKPPDAAQAAHRWRRMRGRTGTLHTGHCLRDLAGQRTLTRVASTLVHFADITDGEIDAYVATGEPLGVAGGFTLDGLGGAFITGIEGDPHTVIGVSLPLLREMLAELGVAWPALWAATPPAARESVR